MTPTPEHAQKMLDAEAANMLAKLKAGGTLKASERKALKDIRDASKPEDPASKPGRKSTGSERWTLEHAEREFGPDRSTIAKKLREIDAEPGDDGMYSTRQIFRALGGGDKEASLTRKAAADAAMAEMEEQRMRETLIELSVVKLVWCAITSGVQQRFLGVPAKLESRLGLNREQVKGLQAEIKEVLHELTKATAYAEPGGPETDG